MSANKSAQLLVAQDKKQQQDLDIAPTSLQEETPSIVVTSPAPEGKKRKATFAEPPNKRFKNHHHDGKFVRSTSPETPTVKKVGIQLVKSLDTQTVFESVKDSLIKSPIVSPGSVCACYYHSHVYARYNCIGITLQKIFIWCVPLVIAKLIRNFLPL